MDKERYFVRYDIDSKTQYLIENDKITKTVEHKVCPYIWCGKLKEDIEAGLIKWVAWEYWRLPSPPDSSAER